MKLPSTLCALGITCLLPNVVQAFSLKVVGRRNDARAATLLRRESIQGASPLSNSADISYHANITLGGKAFSVLVDTGSTDLWVAGTVPGARDSGATSGVQYAVGAVEGPIKFADAEFAGYFVDDQAYLEIVPSKENKEGEGLIGLGPVSGSNIWNKLQTDESIPLLDRIFRQDLKTPNYITSLLGRFEDPTDIFAGDITIGEIIEGYEEVQNQAKLPCTIVPVRNQGNQHFQILLDEDSIIGPDGQPIPVRTEVDDTKNKKQATAVVDTGFSLTQVPKFVADSIYSRYTGAEYVNVGGVGNVWIVPCELEVNITFKFSGQEIPIHPLDATLNPALLNLPALTNSQGQKSCMGTYQPISFDHGDNPSYDIILGMSFIRNAYTLYNFGDFVHGPEKRGEPYLQFLATTEKAEAHNDFVQVRLGGLDNTGNQVLLPSSAKANNHSGEKKILGIPKLYLILGIVAIALALLLVIASVFICLRRRRRQYRGTSASLGKYKPLDTPPQGGVKPLMMSGPSPPANVTYNPNANAHAYNPSQGQPLYDPQPPTYGSPWDQRH